MSGWVTSRDADASYWPAGTHNSAIFAVLKCQRRASQVFGVGLVISKLIVLELGAQGLLAELPHTGLGYGIDEFDGIG
jgi:hypothetical protein